jgi:hypothetical protein
MNAPNGPIPTTAGRELAAVLAGYDEMHAAGLVTDNEVIAELPCPKCGARRQVNLDDVIIHARAGSVECPPVPFSEEPVQALLGVIRAAAALPFEPAPRPKPDRRSSLSKTAAANRATLRRARRRFGC